jgi:hypothetical protein
LDVQQIILTDNTNLQSFSGKEEPGISPNPSSGWCQITGVEASVLQSVQVTDMKGREILRTTAGKSGFDISHLASGVYMVKIKTMKGSYSLKLIRE